MTEEAGKMELLKTPLYEARMKAQIAFALNGRNLFAELPHFDSHYHAVQEKVEKYSMGMMRKQMPVIEQADIPVLKAWLEKHQPHDYCALRHYPVDHLHPIQTQIYFDKAIEATAKFGVEKTRTFLSNNWLVVSKEHDIIDGHHRWLSANLISPDLMNIQAFIMPDHIHKALKFALKWSDEVGKERNK